MAESIIILSKGILYSLLVSSRCQELVSLSEIIPEVKFPFFNIYI